VSGSFPTGRTMTTTDLCDEPHPDRPDVLCRKDKPCWGSHYNPREDVSWPGRQLPGNTPRTTLVDMARRADHTPPSGPPIVRTIDPPTAHEAARRIQPKRGTAKARVLDYLRRCAPEWVDAPELTDSVVGGSEGLRRVRELRQEGWEIETRPAPGSQTAWQYRLPPTVALDPTATKG
jgi:hypothetical protein